MSSDSASFEEPDSPEATPASPDYVHDLEELEQAPPSPDYVPGPEYPKYLALADDEIVADDQPYADYASPAALSPGYVADSDPEEDPEDGPVDYPADGGNDDDDDDSSNDEEEEKEEASEEHLALANSVIAPTIDYVPFSEETDPFKMDESAATPPPPTYQEEVERLLALPPPPPSPLISLPPPSAKECLARCLAAPALPSSPLPIAPPPYGSPNHVRAPPGFRSAMGRLRASLPSTHHPLHPSPPLPPLPSSLYLALPVPISSPLPSPPLPKLPASLSIPPPVDRREDIPEVELPPRHRADYGFINTLDAETRRQRDEEVGYGIRDVWEEDTQDIYAMIEDAQDRQTQLSQRVDELIEDRQFHKETGQLSAALGHIQALQARDPTHADDPEGANSCA
ncbi:hypothetical protein Tco_0145059 [Tanacetum coccineum]